MEYGWPPELEQFRAEVKEFLARIHVDELMREANAEDPESRHHSAAVNKIRDEVNATGWGKLSWSKELGGEGKSSWYQQILAEELEKAGVPMSGPVPWIAPAIERFGTDEQKQRFLPGIYSNEIHCAFGYSEPNAGTDLASLETTAVRDGDDWVINGQKLWTSSAHWSSHVWLAVRTDQSAPKHRGISMFIVPLNTPGISVRPIRIVHGGRTNEVFFENVRVPGWALIGEEGRGWYVAATALDVERAGIGSGLSHRFTYEKLLGYLKESRPKVLADRAVRLRLAELKLELHCQRVLGQKIGTINAAGGVPNMEASMAKVLGSELGHRINSVAMDLTGRAGVLYEGQETVPVDGAFKHGYLLAPQYRFGGGTNEVQRNIIAQRGLGLPR